MILVLVLIVCGFMFLTVRYYWNKENEVKKEKDVLLQNLEDTEIVNKSLQDKVKKLKGINNALKQEWEVDKATIVTCSNVIEVMKNHGNCKHREECCYEFAWGKCEKWECFTDEVPINPETKILGERVLQLQKDKGCLTDEVNELKAQIKRLKTCDSCKKNIYDDEKELFVCSDKTCKHLDKWECKE